MCICTVTVATDAVEQHSGTFPRRYPTGVKGPRRPVLTTCIGESPIPCNMGSVADCWSSRDSEMLAGCLERGLEGGVGGSGVLQGVRCCSLFFGFAGR
jgi:hypothetical protein